MTEVLLFHRAQCVPRGITAFAEELRAPGHTVHVPDLFDGRTFGSIDEGMAFIKAKGFRSRLSDADFAELGSWFGTYPEMTLRAYGYEI